MDTGYFRYHTTGSPEVDQMIANAVANGATGGYVGPGVMSSTSLAARFGLNAAPAGGGGSNFANGGAYTAPLRASESDPYSSGVFPTNVSITQQIQNYLTSTNGAANPKALYMINSGNNDLLFVQQQSAAWIAANPQFLQGLASTLAANVATLYRAGARTILVPNSYNSAVFAGLGGAIAPENAELYARSLSYGKTRWASLSAAGVRFIPGDIDSLFRFVVQNPTLFGFTAESVLAANAPSPLSALLTTWNQITPEQMERYLFIDGKHMTTAGQRIEADYYSSLLTAPSQISRLAEGPVQGGLTRMATIQGQLDLPKQQRGPNGINVWANGGISALEIKNSPGHSDESGVPLDGSVGADYQTSFGLVLGAAFTAGYQNQEFSKDGGHFTQTDQTLSLYATYRAGPVWGNVVGGYSLYQDAITRQVQLGRFTDQNNATTAGLSWALALRAGGDISLGPITTGPVVGSVLQQVRIDGFTETGDSGVTALSFGKQTRDSLVSQLGWRIVADLSDWSPFVEAKWNHEWADTDRMLSVALTSTSAPSYAMAAPPVTKDWMDASVGVSYKINEQVMLKGTVSATMLNPQVTTYGANVGVTVSF